MNDLVRLGVALAQGAAVLRQPRATERVVVRSGLVLAAASFAAAALGCGLAGLWLYTAPRLGAVAAALIVAIILALLSGGAFALSHRRPATSEPAASLDLTPALLAGELAAIIAANKGVALLAAALAGVLLARRER